MENVISIHSSNAKQIFSVAMAKELLPVIFHITESHQLEVRKLANRLESIKSVNADKAKDLEKQINAEVNRWQDKIQRLGAVPKGLWLVDFDNGEGYFCWKFPENDIRFFHGYQDGFSGRVEIE